MSAANTARLFWIETVLGSIAGLLGVLTIFWQDWIEAIFNVGPDNGDGGVEWLIIVVLLLVSATCGFAARHHWTMVHNGASRGALAD